MLPQYLDMPIDILSDSVLEICEKVAFKAHDGTYVEGLWDASFSTCVGLIDEPEDWTPLSVNTNSNSIRHSYDTEVSEVPDYCLKSHHKPFFGYTSEGPVAPAFREQQPIGLGATALKALGEMHALLKLDERDSDIPALDDWFCDMWGLRTADLERMHYMEPILTHRSQADLLKSVRSKSHRLFGYENEQSYVSVSMGSYDKSALNEDRYVDWHRVALILRYIGVYMMTTDEAARDKYSHVNLKLCYGLVLREFPLVTKSPHMPSFAGMPRATRNELTTAAMTYAISFYSSDRILSSIAFRNALIDDKVKFSESFQVGDISLASLRANLATSKKAFTFSLVPSDPIAYDIMDPSKPKASLLAKIGDTDILHQISAYRALELVVSARMIRMWNRAEHPLIRTVADKARQAFAMDDVELATYHTDLVRIVGLNSGYPFYATLKRYNGNPHVAEDKFVALIRTLLDPGLTLSDNNVGSIFTAAISSTNAVDFLSDLVRNAHAKVVHWFNHPSVSDMPISAELTPEQELQGLIMHLWRKKVRYWDSHYNSRRLQLTNSMKDPGNRVASKLHKLVRYQWLCNWLPKFTVEVTTELQVWPRIKNGIACELLYATAQAYARKKNDKAHTYGKDEPFKAYAHRLDTKYRPRILFAQMVIEVEDTVKLMTRDTHHLLLRAYQKQPEVETDIFADAQFVLDNAARRDATWALLTKEDSIVSWADALEDLSLGEVEMFPSDEAIRIAAHDQVMANQLALPENRLATMCSNPDVPPEGYEVDEDIDLDDADIEFAPVILGDIDIKEAFDTLAGARSPIAELQDAFGSLPDLLAWARRANVEVSKLGVCTSEEYPGIFRAGQEELNVIDVSAVIETYDVE